MKRKVYAFLIKNTFTSWVDPKQKNFYRKTAKKLIRKYSVCCFKNRWLLRTLVVFLAYFCNRLNYNLKFCYNFASPLNFFTYFFEAEPRKTALLD